MTVHQADPDSHMVGEDVLAITTVYGEQLLQGELYEDVVALLLPVLDCNVESGEVHGQLAHAYLSLGEADEAIEAPNFALALFSKN